MHEGSAASAVGDGGSWATWWGFMSGSATGCACRRASAWTRRPRSLRRKASGPASCSRAQRAFLCEVGVRLRSVHADTDIGAGQPLPPPLLPLRPRPPHDVAPRVLGHHRRARARASQRRRCRSWWARSTVSSSTRPIRASRRTMPSYTIVARGRGDSARAPLLQQGHRRSDVRQGGHGALVERIASARRRRLQRVPQGQLGTIVERGATKHSEGDTCVLDGSGGDLRDWARDALFVGETYVLEVPPSATLRPQSREFVGDVRGSSDGDAAARA